MNTRHWFAALVLLSLLGTASAQGGAWKTFTSKPGAFVIDMPGTPKEQRHTAGTGASLITLHLLVLDLPKDQGSYVVIWSDFPEAASDLVSPDQKLDTACAGAVASSKGKQRSKKTIMLDKHPGRELLIEAPGGSLIRVRMYVVRDRLYQVMVAGTRKTATSADADRFFASFKLRK